MVTGRTFDPDLHKLDHDGNKGHGRHVFLCREISTGGMCYLDSNYGGRSEAYNYQEYDICRQQHRMYWSNTLLPADPSIGRHQAQWVDWTGVADAAYTMAVHNAAGAPVWYHPIHSNRANEELNQGAEFARAVVEHQFGRIGTEWVQL